MANNYNGCNNNCEAVAGLQEKAANLGAYSDLINAWLNGPASGTVDIAGVNTPTLLKLVTDFRTKINQMPQSILQQSGGIAIDENGKLYINFATMPDSILYGLLQKIVLEDGGLAFNDSGKMYVDFDSMPTNKFDSILETFRKGLRLPKWLIANKNFYVDKNHVNASNELDEGRGESANKPFKNIQACVNYIAENYNLASYNATILIANGDYTEQGRINLPAYTTNTGRIYIKGVSNNSADVKTQGYFLSRDSLYEIWSQTLLNYYQPDSWGACAQVWAGQLSLRNVLCDLSNLDSNMTARSYGALSAINGGTIRFYAYDDNDLPTGITIKNTGNFIPAFIMQASNKGVITMAADINAGSNLVYGTFLTVDTGGLFSRTLSSFINPGRAAQFNKGSYNFAGKRYSVGALSQIYNVGGPTFFPGTTDGTKDDLGAYS